jgi:hypothetical protein
MTDKYYAGSWTGFLFSLPYFALLLALGFMLMLNPSATSKDLDVVNPEEQSNPESGEGSAIPESNACK